MPTRPLASLALGLALVAAACSSGSSDSSADEVSRSGSKTPATKSGCDGTVEAPSTRFIVDACGRVLILRGVNVESSSKGTKQSDVHLPGTPLDAQRFLQTWGWNNVRFLVFWGAIEPERGEFDDNYLANVKTWMDWYAARGIHVVLDMHQDLYAWKVGGNGAPDWAVDTKGAKVKPPADGAPWYAQGADPAVQNAYQSFWNPTEDQPDLQKEYLKALAHLAGYFKDHPAVIGYDVMNEPSFANGDLDATLAVQDQAAAGTFENPNLTQFMQGGIDAVRSQDQDAWVMVQPTSLLNAFPYAGDLEFDELKDPRKGPPRLAYAGHLYDPDVHDGKGYADGDTYVKTWQDFRAAEAEEMKAALWFGEWGGDPNQEGMSRYIHDVTTMADEEMAGWAWWSWDPGGWGPLLEGGESLSPNGQALLRAQPRAIAGTPTSFAWDADQQVFRMDWDERRDATGATEIAVPASLYFEGIEVVLDGKPVADPDWDRTTSVLKVSPDRTKATHTICVGPADYGLCR